MSEQCDIPSEDQLDMSDTNITAASSSDLNTTGSVKFTKTQTHISSSSERQIKFERAQKCLENAALVSKRIKEHRKATAELLGRPFDDDGDTASEMASTMSERTGYSAATDISTPLSVQDALNIPGISESLANTLKQKELLMERIKQYKEISKRPINKSAKKDSVSDSRTGVRKMAVDNKDICQLHNIIKEKDNLLSVLQVKMKAMETTILDLQEKINEKDQIIEAKNKATTIISDSLSKKEKDTMALLEDTRKQMTKMQENFIAMEVEWNEEKQRLLKEIETKDQKINNLEEANTILENARFEISVAHSQLVTDLDAKNNEILHLEQKLNKLTLSLQNQESPVKQIIDEEKGSLEISNMVELTKKIELLEQLNCQIRQTNKELENKIAAMNSQSKSTIASSPSKKGSPLTTRKGGRSTPSKMKSPWSQISSESIPQESDKKFNKDELVKLENVVKSLNKDILEKEYMISQKETTILQLQSDILEKQTLINELQATLKNNQKTSVDIGVCTENSGCEDKIEEQIDFVSKNTDNTCSTSIKELEENLKSAQKEITNLNEEIEAANKNMIKVKSNHKLKLKQLQKTIDNFSKVSDANAEIVKLSEEVHCLSQKVAELEEEKGNLQLHLVDYDSGRLTESDVYKKMLEMENLSEARLKAISVLEMQKFDLVQELHVLQQKNIEMEDKLADISQLQTEQVSSEMKSVQLEEQIDALIASENELQLVVENLKLDKQQLNITIDSLRIEKEELCQKLNHYIQENMELTDKLEKLSTEKVSSAESIEIVESLTTQEKLELEEYNKELTDGKSDASKEFLQSESQPSNENVAKLVEESAELNKKIELFTQERQEVMNKMAKISAENESLQQKMEELVEQSTTLQMNITILNNEKEHMSKLNIELNNQIEELKRERIEIMKESIAVAKPAPIEDAIEGISTEVQVDDKSGGDKSNSRTKSVKQLTKEILKLKNTIKEREAEIGDCQMKILALEEQQQKQADFIQNHTSYENKLKTLTEENFRLKEEIDLLRKNNESEHQLLQFKEANELLQVEIHRIQQEYTNTVNIRDSSISELENLLKEYEKQIYNYNNTLEQKDKEMSEYINQITKLNDVSQKLKSTIELLEEEKAKDQNAELSKSLNKQIVVYQKKLAEYEEKLRFLEDEKAQLVSIKNGLENRNNSLDTELKKLQETVAEKQNLIKELQMNQQKHKEDILAAKQEAKDKDEEIHEIKLQLRKESIENEKLRSSLSTRDKDVEQLKLELVKFEQNLSKITLERDQANELYATIENKNKELIVKLKKFAITIKKKSSQYNDLENTLKESQSELETKNLQLEQLLIQVDTLPSIQEKLKYAEDELNRLQSLKITMENNKFHEIKTYEEKLEKSTKEIAKLNELLVEKNQELLLARDENYRHKNQIDSLNNKLVEFEIEQKSNLNFATKITSLEIDINNKQLHITDLLTKLENQEQLLNQLKFGHEAKIQERDLFIESLEAEINKYKNRINRLEESISVMEDRRHSLECKADHLDNQLQEKHKAYNEYSNQEDELINRLASLMHHDRVVQKQLHEIESENKELIYKIQHINEENQRLRASLSEKQDYCNTLVDKANRFDFTECELEKCQAHIHELETNIKKITNEHQTLLSQRKQEIEELESEFNTQVENAIKEKKILNEKYEKINEHVSQLEVKLQGYKSEIENLNINLEDLTRVNQELMEKSPHNEQYLDYTEQYVIEINRLNSVLNSKSEDINNLRDKINAIETLNISIKSNCDRKISELMLKIQDSTEAFEQLSTEANSLKRSNKQLQEYLSEKDEEIKQLLEKKKVSFEMNIPKTEGMIISSTIEELSHEPKTIDIPSLESQIIPQTFLSEPEIQDVNIKISEHMQKQPAEMTSSGEIIEPVIIPKKAYLCYKGEDNSEEKDPFNSDEGWGLGECEVEDVIPGLSHMNDKIRELQRENESLKVSLDAGNTKLLKAMKKLKELKTANDLLANELKVSKQVSQSSFLNNAIEEEFRSNIEELEKKIEDLDAELSKEKHEKATLKKQNEIFNNANDRLTEMKEKMGSEIELWKFKFKEVSDKLNTLQWGSDPKDSQETISKSISKPDNVQFAVEISKLEKENEELQLLIDQLTCDNKQLSIDQNHLKEEINSLNIQLQEREVACNNCQCLNNELLNLQQVNFDLIKQNDILNKKICEIEDRLNESEKNYEKLNARNQDLQETLGIKNNEFDDTEKRLQQEITTLKDSESKLNSTVSSLLSELETFKLRLNTNNEPQTFHKQENEGETAHHKSYKEMDYCMQLRQITNKKEEDLIDSDRLILQLNNEKCELIQKLHVYEQQTSELSTQLENLKIENNQLLLTVEELRSSISSAVDQRGFEIAELWKQHLTQRETEFKKIEHDLRTELNAIEAKYEELVDNTQSSSSEETTKVILMEQVNSLQVKLSDTEEHVRNLQDNLRSIKEDEEKKLEYKLKEQQEKYDKEIEEVSSERKKFENLITTLQAEILALKTKDEELNKHLVVLRHDLEISENRNADLVAQLQKKDAEIFEKYCTYADAIQKDQEIQKITHELEKYQDELKNLSHEKESELAVLRLKMHENEEYHKKIEEKLSIETNSLTEALNDKIVECTNLNKQITDLNQLLADQSTRAMEMQKVLESQELEIVNLKEEIVNMETIMRSQSNKIEKHVTFASGTKSGIELQQTEAELNKELLDVVPRAELDLAMYMLHQRDMRCEEFTMELTQLLEERDTLQLRLSDSLRSYEELKTRYKSAGLDLSMSSSQETIPEFPNLNVEKDQQSVDSQRVQTSRSSSISDPDGEKPKLQAKLTELRSLKQSKDVRLRQESEQRQLGMRLLQRDVANLPSEAVDQLTQAHHTLSRDSQSTSTVLLNWLRGKSTPKVIEM